MIKKWLAAIVVIAITTIAVFCVNPYGSINLKSASPSSIIYKTKKDYSKYVPITLSDNKSKVVNYPDPKGVYYKGKLAYPTSLVKGFWLDNRGIGVNSVFIKLTYEGYSKLPNAPTLDELYAMIIDKDPFTEIIDLGSRYEVKEINKLIDEHKLNQFKSLK